MKIKAPDHIETITENKVEIDTPIQGDGKFVQEIKDILEMPKISPKFVAEETEYGTPQYTLEVLRKFTALCREEIVPRHHKAAEIIQSKSDELHRMQIVQQRDLEQLFLTSEELKESRDQLKAKIEQTQTTHHLLAGRLKTALHILQDHCKNKTIAERKMAQDLVNFEEKTKDLKVNMTATKAKVNYYASQLNTQTEEVAKHTKPLYLDKNRAVFIRSNLNSMRENIEQMVNRVKTLKNQMAELEEPDYQEDYVKD